MQGELNGGVWDCHTHIYGPWDAFPLPADAAFLRKPFQPEDLARLLRSVLDRAPARSLRI